MDSNLMVNFSAIEFKRSIGTFGSNLTSINMSARLKCWKELVIVYSKCGLTREEDRLIALSGLAKRFRTLIGSRYVGGLWQVQDMVSQLSWYTAWTKQSLPTRRPGLYLSPSWSWPSVDVPIASWPDVHADAKLKLLEISVTPRGLDDTGQLEGGSLRISRTLQRVFLPTNPDDDRIDSSSFPVSFDGHAPIWGVAYYPDPIHEEDSNRYPFGQAVPTDNRNYLVHDGGMFSLYLGKNPSYQVYMILRILGLRKGLRKGPRDDTAGQFSVKTAAIHNFIH
jgi:hypothetical protein